MSDRKGSSPKFIRCAPGLKQRWAKHLQEDFKLSWAAASALAVVNCGGGAALPFQLLFKTTAPDETITLPLEATTWIDVTPVTYNFLVDWGDGQSDTITAYNQAEKTHTYASSGDHVVQITGQCPMFRFNWNGDYLKIYEIQSWGNPGFVDLNRAFAGCGNLTVTATDVPDLTTCPDMGRMWYACQFVEANLAAWDVSGVTNFEECFIDCGNFNEDIGGWDTSSAIYIGGMFLSAVAFNQDISGWNVSGVLNMGTMFRDATAFNQPIGVWNVTAVTDFAYMFYQADAFNQSLSSWDMTGTTKINSMFREAIAFDQDVSGWDVNDCVDFRNFLEDATAFSTANYDLLLNGWSLLGSLSPSEAITIDATYTIATSQAAHDVLTDPPNSWGITDNGGI